MRLCVNNQYRHALDSELKTFCSQPLCGELHPGSSDWLRVITWPGYLPLIGQPPNLDQSGSWCHLMMSSGLYRDPQKLLRNFSSFKRSWKYETQPVNIEHSYGKWKFLIKSFSMKRRGLQLHLHGWILFWEFINLGGWLRRKSSITPWLRFNLVVFV